MGPGPKINPSTPISWTEASIEAIYKATTEASFSDAFDAFFAEQVEITVNGSHVRRSDYKAEIWQRKADQLSAGVTFKDVVQVNADDNKVVQVGAFYNATITDHLVHTNTVTSSSNFTVEQGELVVFSGESERSRRVVALNETQLYVLGREG
ncbi:uncharacterized protein FIBRA_01849 [Fibroporia radiculosa]|uniref:Cyclic nucleotide-binding domain-containing protein n=1 Tax=Fibroporia radiculosa TaxID=599839 RepID=J4GLJ8_9APHY|nr:uncharacterized protein FIBRA_01849 [Fibroporia radiculosa]CCL99825.1 predicted protein [Fibroporia radiculosa]